MMTERERTEARKACEGMATTDRDLTITAGPWRSPEGTVYAELNDARGAPVLCYSGNRRFIIAAREHFVAALDDADALARVVAVLRECDGPDVSTTDGRAQADNIARALAASEGK